MLATLLLEHGEYTPKVVFDASSGTLELSGRSLPADAIAFYKPLFVWVEEYIENPYATTEITMNMDYFNTSSTKQLVDLLIMFEQLHQRTNFEVIVYWSYEKDDDVMLVRGEEIESILKLPFEYRAHG